MVVCAVYVKAVFLTRPTTTGKRVHLIQENNYEEPVTSYGLLDRVGRHEATGFDVGHRSSRDFNSLPASTISDSDKKLRLKTFCAERLHIICH